MLKLGRYLSWKTVSSHLTTLSNGSAPGIQTSSRSTVKRFNDWASPAAVKIIKKTTQYNWGSEHKHIMQVQLFYSYEQ